MNVFTTFVAFMAPSTFITFFLLRYYALAFIYFMPETMFSGSWISAFSVFIILALAAIIIAYFVTKPFNIIIKKIKEENYIPTLEETKTCLNCHKSLVILDITVITLGFFIGQIIVTYMAIKAGRHENDTVQTVLILAQAFSFGAMCALVTLKGLDSKLAEFRRLLRIKSLDDFPKQRAMSFGANVVLVSVVCLVFLGINMTALLLGAVKHNTGTLFISKGIQCFSFSIIICLIPIWFVVKGLSSRMKTTTQIINQISKDGNLSKRLNIAMLDDFGSMITSINMMISKLNQMIKELKEKTGNAGVAADEIADSADSASVALDKMVQTLNKIDSNSEKQDTLIHEADSSILSLADSISNIKKHIMEQETAVENISSSISKITANINNVALTAKEAQTASNELSVTNEKGKASIENAVSAMSQIQQSSLKVQTIIKAIEDVSAKTNLLSMNAAIEASHAGAYGAGFAVVANEVRALAALSADSAKEIQDQITDMAEKIDFGVDAINSAGSSFKDISTKVELNASYVKNISEAMDHQLISAKTTQQSTESVVQTIQAVSQLTSKEAKSAEEVRNFMQTVVDASNSTKKAVSEGVADTNNLKDSIAKVDRFAESNKQSVDVIEKQISQFTV